MPHDVAMRRLLETIVREAGDGAVPRLSASTVASIVILLAQIDGVDPRNVMERLVPKTPWRSF